MANCRVTFCQQLNLSTKEEKEKKNTAHVGEAHLSMPHTGKRERPVGARRFAAYILSKTHEKSVSTHTSCGAQGQMVHLLGDRAHHAGRLHGHSVVHRRRDHCTLVETEEKCSIWAQRSSSHLSGSSSLRPPDGFFLLSCINGRKLKCASRKEGGPAPLPSQRRSIPRS